MTDRNEPHLRKVPSVLESSVAGVTPRVVPVKMEKMNRGQRHPGKIFYFVNYILQVSKLSKIGPNFDIL